MKKNNKSAHSSRSIFSAIACIALAILARQSQALAMPALFSNPGKPRMALLGFISATTPLLPHIQRMSSKQIAQIKKGLVPFVTLTQTTAELYKKTVRNESIKQLASDIAGKTIPQLIKNLPDELKNALLINKFEDLQLFLDTLPEKASTADVNKIFETQNTVLAIIFALVTDLLYGTKFKELWKNNE